MKKFIIAATAAAGVLTATAFAPQPAEARGGRIAAGIFGGLAAGAILGGALHGGYYGGYGYYGPRYYGGYAPGYYGYGPAYYGGYAPAYYGGYGGCYLRRERFWDGFGWRVRRVQICG